jgi:hypothetical protein
VALTGAERAATFRRIAAAIERLEPVLARHQVDQGGRGIRRGGDQDQDDGLSGDQEDARSSEPVDGQGQADLCRAQSWRYLAHHTAICRQLAAAALRQAEGDAAGARAAWEQALRYVREREPELHPVLDVYEFSRVLGRRFASPAAAPA